MVTAQLNMDLNQATSFLDVKIISFALFLSLKARKSTKNSFYIKKR
jgi:hypothetical protein